ncbi:7 transmembrane sweet-taste receptor of 3 GCPR-domain-containing protein [Powellomyces hirtus]|nr:7 transmembrane sweet-taste receptor of 3 GCPR-domain-containing protein [Powellomyces hirtus]
MKRLMSTAVALVWVVVLGLSGRHFLVIHIRQWRPCRQASVNGDLAVAKYQRQFVDRSQLNMSMIYFADATDPLFVVIENAARSSASLLNVTLLGALPATSSQNQGTQLQQIQDAIDSRSMGLISTLHDEANVYPLLVQAAKAGAAILSYNNGYEQTKKIGSIGAVAEDLYAGGVALGTTLASAPWSVQRPVCILLNLEAIYAIDRCSGALYGYNQVTGKNLQFGALNTATTQLVEVDNSAVTSSLNQVQAKKLADFLDQEITVDALFLTQASLIPNVKAAIGRMAVPRQIRVAVNDYNPQVRAELDANSTYMQTVVAEGQQPFIQGFMTTLYMFTHLTLNESLSDYLVPSGPFLVDTTAPLKARADKVSQVEQMSSFNLTTPRRIATLFHEPNNPLYTDQANILSGIKDAAALWKYTVDSQPITDFYDPVANNASLYAIFANCTSSPSTCPSALVTSYPNQDFVNRAAALTQGLPTPIPYFVLGASNTADVSARNPDVTQYLGIDDEYAGRQAAKLLIEAGATKPVCVGPDMAPSSYHRRCGGMIAEFLAQKNIAVDTSYMSTSLENAQAILRSLMQAKGYDSLLCTLPSLCGSLFAAISTSTTPVTAPKYIVSIGLTVRVMKAISAGEMIGAIDTVPYSHGFISLFHVGAQLEGSTNPSTQVLHIGQTTRTWACPPGMAFNANGQMYQRLPSGMMSMGNVCKPCEPHTQAPVASMLTCTACPVGTYADQLGAITCASCDDGIGKEFAVCRAYFKGTEQPPASRSAIRALAGIAGGVTALLGLGLFLGQEEPIIRKASPPLSIGVLMGSMLVIIAVFLQQWELNTARCSASMWMLATGFGLAVGCVFVKNFRLHRIFNNPRLRADALSFSYLGRQLAIILAFEWLLLAIWTGVSPPGKMLTTSGNGQAYAACSSENSIVQSAFSALLIIYNAGLLIANIAVGFLNRNLREDFSETQYISWASYNIIICAALGIAVGYIGIDNNFRHGVVFATITFAALGLPVILFATRLFKAYTDRRDGVNKGDQSGSGKAGTTTGFISKGSGTRNRSASASRVNVVQAMVSQNVPVAVHKGKLTSVWDSYKATLVIFPRGAGVMLTLVGSDPKAPAETFVIGPGNFLPHTTPEGAADGVLFLVLGRRTVSIQLENQETYTNWESHFKGVSVDSNRTGSMKPASASLPEESGGGGRGDDMEEGRGGEEV